jgi:hypothetical protein
VNRREVTEILAAHADQGDSSASPPGVLTRNDRVQGLLDLAEQLQGILVPVEPEPSFRRRLHGDLILEAQRRQAESTQNLFRQHRKGIILGAAAVGSVASLVGVALAFVLRYRQGRATHIATG